MSRSLFSRFTHHVSRNIILIIITTIIICVISGCQVPLSQSQIETAVAGTEAARPTATLTPTPGITVYPSSTPNPTSPPSYSSAQIEATRQAILDSFFATTKKYISQVVGVKNVNLIRFEKGALVIEVAADYSSESIIKSMCWDIMIRIAPGLSELEESFWNSLSGGPAFSLKLTILSSNLDKRFVSTTFYSDLVKIKKSQITYDEWVKASGAKFTP